MGDSPSRMRRVQSQFAGMWGSILSLLAVATICLALYEVFGPQGWFPNPILREISIATAAGGLFGVGGAHNLRLLFIRWRWTSRSTFGWLGALVGFVPAFFAIVVQPVWVGIVCSAVAILSSVAASLISWWMSRPDIEAAQLEMDRVE